MKQKIHGFHAVQAALKNKYNTLHTLFASRVHNGKKNPQRLKSLLELAETRDVTIQFVSMKELDKMAGNKHQGIVLEVGLPKAKTEDQLWELISSKADSEQQPFLLILDGVTDPRNLGASLRSAAAAGVDGIILPKNRSAELTSVAYKAASGAAEMVPCFRITNLSRTLSKLQEFGIWVVGADGDADTSLYELDLTGGLAVVLGAEGSGLRRLTKEKCNALAAIPMEGAMSSLNVSVAAGIVLFESVRQRKS